MTRITRAAALTTVALLASGLGAPAWAQTHTRVTDKGDADPLHLSWDLTYVQIEGLADRGIQTRVNESLRKFAVGHKQALAEDEELDPVGDSPKNDVYVDMQVETLSERILSVRSVISLYFSGAAHPDNGFASLNYDLRTGARVKTRDLFARGSGVLARVARLAAAKMRQFEDLQDEDGTYLLYDPTADDIHSVTVAPDGLTMHFDHYAHAIGVVRVALSYDELAGLLNEDGILEGLAKPGDSYGEDEPGEEGTLSEMRALYLAALEVDARDATSDLSWQERHRLDRDAGWRKAETAKDLIDHLQSNGLGNVADGLRDAISTTRRSDPEFRTLPFLSMAEAEGAALEAALESVLKGVVSGRVMTQGGRVLVREDGTWGEPVVRLPHDTPVGVTGPYEGGRHRLFHRVLVNGRASYIHRNNLLLEQRVAVEGQVGKGPRGLTIEVAGRTLSVVGKDGPGHPDAVLAKLARNVGKTVRLDAISRRISFREWLAPLSFEVLEGYADDRPSTPEQDDRQGILEQVPGDY